MLHPPGTAERFVTEQSSRLAGPGFTHPDFLLPVSARAEWLSEDSDVATARTIERMGAIVEDGRRDRRLVGLSNSLCAGADRAACAASIHEWVRTHVQFVPDSHLAAPLAAMGVDPSLAEVLVHPRQLVRMPQPKGDCDDFSMLVASLLLNAGIPCSFATVAADRESPGRYSHVYVVAHLPDGDFPIDASHGAVAGWEVPNLFGKLREWGVGMGGYGMGFVAPAASGFDWGSLLGPLIQSGTNIAQTVLQKPVYQSGPTGTTIYQGQVPTVTAPGGAGGEIAAPQIVPGVSNTVLLLGGLALVAVVMASKK